MAVKVSLHAGSKLSQQHNRRQQNRTARDGHIDEQRTAQNIVIKDENIREAYDKIFSSHIRAYDAQLAKRRQQCRQIGSSDEYLKSLSESSTKKPCYEIIYQIGSRDEQIPQETAVSILKEIAATFQTRNGNLYMLGAYIHVDEATSHLHLDYIPLARSKRGMALQNSSNAAFEAMIGRKSKSRKETAQIMWQGQEREYVRKLCHERGIETDEIKHGRGVAHLDTEIFKAQKELAEAEEKLEAIRREQEDIEKALRASESLSESYDTYCSTQEQEKLRTAENLSEMANQPPAGADLAKKLLMCKEGVDGWVRGPKVKLVPLSLAEKMSAALSQLDTLAHDAAKLTALTGEQYRVSPAAKRQISEQSELIRTQAVKLERQSSKLIDALQLADKATEKLELLEGKLAGKYPAAYKELVLGEQVSSRGAAKRAR